MSLKYRKTELLYFKFVVIILKDVARQLGSVYNTKYDLCYTEKSKRNPKNVPHWVLNPEPPTLLH